MTPTREDREDVRRALLRRRRETASGTTELDAAFYVAAKVLTPFLMIADNAAEANLIADLMQGLREIDDATGSVNPLTTDRPEEPATSVRAAARRKRIPPERLDAIPPVVMGYMVRLT